MNFITKKAIDRRTMLRGIGTAFALPLLDGMFPALTAYANSPAKPVNRFGAIYVPNGIVMEQWTPITEGADFVLPQTLAPLKPFRDRLLVLSGLSSVPPPNADPNDVHPKASTRFLSDVPPKATRGGSELHAGISMDQIAAQSLGKHTQLASLELGLETSESGGSCASGFSCAYTSTISWRSAATPLPMENDPRIVFERMFGDSGNTNASARRMRMQEDGSILDSVIQETARLEKSLGSNDRVRLTEYFQGIRDIERRIQKAEEQSSRELPAMEHPSGVPVKFEDHTKLMYDLIAIAYQSDMTRIVTFMMGRELSGRAYPELGIPDAHHSISHHQGDPAKLAKLAKINNYHVSLFTGLLEKLRSTPDGDGTLLDNVMLVYGAGMSDGNTHDPLNLPILVAGGGCGQLKTGRHIRYSKDTPLANLHLSMLDKLGVPIQRIGDSTSKLDQLSEV